MKAEDILAILKPHDGDIIEEDYDYYSNDDYDSEKEDLRKKFNDNSHDLNKAILDKMIDDEKYSDIYDIDMDILEYIMTQRELRSRIVDDDRKYLLINLVNFEEKITPLVGYYIACINDDDCYDDYRDNKQVFGNDFAKNIPYFEQEISQLLVAKDKKDLVYLLKYYTGKCTKILGKYILHCNDEYFKFGYNEYNRLRREAMNLFPNKPNVIEYIEDMSNKFKEIKYEEDDQEITISLKFRKNLIIRHDFTKDIGQGQYKKWLEKYPHRKHEIFVYLFMRNGYKKLNFDVLEDFGDKKEDIIEIVNRDWSEWSCNHKNIFEYLAKERNIEWFIHLFEHFNKDNTNNVSYILHAISGSSSYIVMNMLSKIQDFITAVLPILRLTNEDIVTICKSIKNYTADNLVEGTLKRYIEGITKV